MIRPRKVLVSVLVTGAITLGFAQPADAYFLPHMAFAVDLAGYMTVPPSNSPSLSGQFQVPSVTCPDNQQRVFFDGFIIGNMRRPSIVAGVDAICSHGIATYFGVALATSKARQGTITDDGQYNLAVVGGRFSAAPGDTFMTTFNWKPWVSHAGVLYGLTSIAVSLPGGGTFNVVGGRMFGDMATFTGGIFSDNWCRHNTCGVNRPAVFTNPVLFNMEPGTATPVGSTWTSNGHVECTVSAFDTSQPPGFYATCPG